MLEGEEELGESGVGTAMPCPASAKHAAAGFFGWWVFGWLLAGCGLGIADFALRPLGLR